MKYAIALALTALFGASVMADEAPTMSTMSLSGLGSVQAEPDEGYITLGVVTKKDTSAEAVRENAVVMSKLYGVLDKHGVTKANIATVNYDISRAWKTVDKNQVFDGYTVTNMVTVTVCELKNFGKILDAVTSAGVNQVSGISFGTSKRSELMDKARVLAVRDAQKRAALLTNALGVKLGQVVTVTESRTYGGREVYAARLSNADTVVSGGTLTIRASVNVTWQLLPSVRASK